MKLSSCLLRLELGKRSESRVQVVPDGHDLTVSGSHFVEQLAMLLSCLLKVLVLEVEHSFEVLLPQTGLGKLLLEAGTQLLFFVELIPDSSEFLIDLLVYGAG